MGMLSTIVPRLNRSQDLLIRLHNISQAAEQTSSFHCGQLRPRTVQGISCRVNVFGTSGMNLCDDGFVTELDGM
jgi:hypothetical protein